MEKQGQGAGQRQIPDKQEDNIFIGKFMFVQKNSSALGLD